MAQTTGILVQGEIYIVQMCSVYDADDCHCYVV